MLGVLSMCLHRTAYVIAEAKAFPTGVTTVKLNNKTLNQLPDTVTTPGYSRTDLQHGIIHIGVGGFHRAHQAVYTEHLLQQGQNQQWGICGVGLRDADRAMQQALSSQDFLYTVMELGDQDCGHPQVVGAINDFLFAADDREAVIEKLAGAEVRIVSLTITEGGYNIDDHSGEFDADNADVQHDLAHPDQPLTVFGFITEALHRRRQRKLPPFTVMSCDNLPHNGRVARRALLAYAGLRDPQLQAWMADHVSFPNSMVDRITPMTLPSHKTTLADQYGIEDEWPVVCEPFMQWVLEDDFCNGRPAWEDVGVQVTDNVAPYEKMKIRLLNASHSTMAYLGYLAGYRYAHEVMEDPLFVRFIRDFMDADVTPGLDEVPGVDLEAYKQTLIERFSNSQIGDQLARLCLDGSSKIPKFLLPTVHGMLADGRPLQRVALIIAGWALYLRGVTPQGERYDIVDPLAAPLQAAVADPSQTVSRFLGLEEVFGTQLKQSAAFVAAVEAALQGLEQDGVIASLNNLYDSPAD